MESISKGILLKHGVLLRYKLQFILKSERLDIGGIIVTRCSQLHEVKLR